MITTLTELEHELQLLIRARYPILYLVTWEEDRCETILKKVAGQLGKDLHFWSSSRGFDRLQIEKGDQPLYALSEIERSPDNAVFVLQDFHFFLNPDKNYDLNLVVRKLRDVGYGLRRSHKTIIITSPVLMIPPELEKDVCVVDVPMPNYDEMRGILDSLLQGVSQNSGVKVSNNPTLKERVAKAALGLTAYEAENAFAKAIVEKRSFDDSDLERVLDEKKQIIRKTQVLEFLDLKENFDNVGGLNQLKDWLKNRLHSFSDRARDYGLPQPKGLLLLGVQGCGKSLASKAVGALWTLPLLRLDVGSLFGSFIGSSELNMRRAIKTAESLAPCVLWIDEIEKGFSGMTGSGVSDAGTSSRVFASFLTWLQEKTAPVFVVATANSIKDLPPEFLRKGRFDEIFFIDLPKIEERQAILEIHLKKRKRDPKKFDLPQLARATEGFNGAEIEQAIISALYDTFPKNRDITTDDLMAAIKQTVPLSVTMAENVAEIRAWASKRARPAA